MISENQIKLILSLNSDFKNNLLRNRKISVIYVIYLKSIIISSNLKRFSNK